MATIHLFHQFDDFHRMANGGLSSKHTDIQVFRFEELSKETKEATPLFKTDFYQIGLFEKVQFEITYFDQTVPVTHQGVVVMFKPGQTISFEKTDPFAEGIAVMFKADFVGMHWEQWNVVRDFALLNPQHNSVIFPNAKAFQELFEIGRKMHALYQKDLVEAELEALKQWSMALMQQLNQMANYQEMQSIHPHAWGTALHFKHLVGKHIHETKWVSDYAQMMHLTEKTLFNHLKLTSNPSPKSVINAFIIEESKALLKRQTPIHEVAEYFKFTDASHFSHFFKMQTGVNPKHFKK